MEIPRQAPSRNLPPNLTLEVPQWRAGRLTGSDVLLRAAKRKLRDLVNQVQPGCISAGLALDPLAERRGVAGAVADGREADPAAEIGIATQPPGHSVDHATGVSAIGSRVDRIVHAAHRDGVADIEVLVAAGVGVGRTEVAVDRRGHDRGVGRDRVAVDHVAELEVVGVVDVAMLEVIGQSKVNRRVLLSLAGWGMGSDRVSS